MLKVFPCRISNVSGYINGSTALSEDSSYIVPCIGLLQLVNIFNIKIFSDWCSEPHETLDMTVSSMALGYKILCCIALSLENLLTFCAGNVRFQLKMDPKFTPEEIQEYLKYIKLPEI